MLILNILKGKENNNLTGFLRYEDESKSESTVDIPFDLPPNYSVNKLFSQWKYTFKQKVEPNRPLKFGERRNKENKQETNTPLIPTTYTCEELAKKLIDELNQWLNNTTEIKWQKARDILIKKVKTDHRVIIQTDDHFLRQLPWSEWTIFQDAQVEVTVSNIGYKETNSNLPQYKIIRILTIIGNIEGTDPDFDLQTIQQLEKIKPRRVFVKPLIQPTKRELFETIQDKNGWHILFFTGHSKSNNEGNIGWLYLNNDEPKVSIDDIKNSFEDSIKNGLQLAIFNSCHGLGLAYQLAELNLPQSLVMREEIPHRVALNFLSYFLAEFSEGKSLTSSVRQARRNLQHWEKEYPGVCWLPVIYQNPGTTPLSFRKKTVNRFFLTAIAIIIFSTPFACNPVVDLFNYKIYDNPLKGISIKYPKQWELDEKPNIALGTVATFYSPWENNLDDFQEKVTIRVKKLPQQFTNIEEYTDFALSKIGETRNIQSHQAIKFADDYAYQVIYTGTQDNLSLKWHEIWLIENNTVYTLNYEAEESEYYQLLKYFQKMTDSFKLK